MTLQTHIDRFNLMLGRTSARERLMIAALALVVVGYGAVSMFDIATAVQANWTETSQQLEAKHQQLERRRSSEAQSQFKRQMKEVQTLSYRGPTLSIAMVGAQTDIERLASDAGLKSLTVQPLGDPQGEGRIRTQEFKVQADLDWRALSGLLESFAASPRAIAPRGMSVTDGRPQRLELIVQAVLFEEGPQNET